MSEQELDARYGRTRNRSVDRLIVFISIGVVILGTVIWALFGGWGGNAVSVTHNEIGFTLDGEDVSLTYQVSAPPGAEVACALESMSESFASVAWKVVTIEPGEQRTRVFTETMRAIREPNSAYVVHCWIPEP